jgi:hypothetical protein
MKLIALGFHIAAIVAMGMGSTAGACVWFSLALLFLWIDSINHFYKNKRN